MTKTKHKDKFVKNNIVAYLHCKLCLKELPPLTSPAEWSANDVGWTKEGLQVFCRRHKANVLHVDFEGQRHPAALHRVKEDA